MKLINVHQSFLSTVSIIITNFFALHLHENRKNLKLKLSRVGNINKTLLGYLSMKIMYRNNVTISKSELIKLLNPHFSKTIKCYHYKVNKIVAKT